MDWDAWEPQAPPSGFAARVATAAKDERTKRRRGRRSRFFRGAAWLAAAAALVGAAAFGLHARSTTDADVRAADVRREVTIGAHRRAVLEPGAHVTWSGDLVTQDDGEVFYSVDPGHPLRVHTAMADVEIDAAWVRVGIVSKMTADGSVIVKPITFVVVSEGSATVSHGRERIDLATGETAIATTQVVRRTTASDFSRDLELLATGDGGPARAPEPYGVAPERWAQLVKEGRVQYALPWCSNAKEWTPEPEYLAKLELQPDDGPALAAAYAHSRARVWAAVKPLCAPLVGGADRAEKLGPKPCIQLVLENANDADPNVVQDAARLIAQVHVGLRPSIEPTEPLGPVTRLLVVLTDEPESFEEELVPSLGMDEARRITRGAAGCHWQDGVTSSPPK
jgi:hypothetical protein